MQEQQVRIDYFDNLRIFAAFLIMLLHIAAYQWYVTDIKSTDWFILNAWKTLTDHAVLLYVMISGALFLSRDIPIKKLYSKYILRLLVAYVFWSVIYSVYANYSLGVKSIIKGALNSHYHLWFIPMMIGLYMCVPILKRIVESEKITKYFLIVSFVFAFLVPFVFNILIRFGNGRLAEAASLLNDRFSDMKIYMFIGYSFFFVLGYWINRAEFSKRMRMALYGLGVLGLIFTCVLTSADTVTHGEVSDLFHGNFNLGVLFTLIATFVLFKYNFSGKEEKSSDSSMFRKLIVKLSKYSFGAYLVHDLVIQLINRVTGINAVSFNPIAAVPVIAVVTFVISFGVSALLNVIPGIKKYIV